MNNDEPGPEEREFIDWLDQLPDDHDPEEDWPLDWPFWDTPEPRKKQPTKWRSIDDE
jgi:hypothetical protein